MQKKKTQKEMVYDYIRAYGSISSMEGFEYLNITDTRTAVSRIRKDLEGTDYVVKKKTIYPKSGRAYARWYITTGEAIHCPHCQSTFDSGLVDWINRQHTVWTCPACGKRVREGFINYKPDYPDPPARLRPLN